MRYYLYDFYNPVNDKHYYGITSRLVSKEKQLRYKLMNGFRSIYYKDIMIDEYKENDFKFSRIKSFTKPDKAIAQLMVLIDSHKPITIYNDPNVLDTDNLPGTTLKDRAPGALLQIFDLTAQSK